MECLAVLNAFERSGKVGYNIFSLVMWWSLATSLRYFNGIRCQDMIEIGNDKVKKRSIS